MNKKISALPLGTRPVSKIAPIPTVQSGVTVKVPAEDIAGFYQTKVSLTSAQILAIGVTPIIAVAAPGSGYAVRVIAMTGVNDFNTTPYSAENLSIKADTATRLQFIMYYILAATADTTELAVLQDITGTSGTQIVENKALYLSTYSGANPTSGDSDIDVYITYEIISL